MIKNALPPDDVACTYYAEAPHFVTRLGLSCQARPHEWAVYELGMMNKT